MHQDVERPGNLSNMICGVSEKMADSLITELLVEGSAPKEVRLRYLRNAQSNTEELQERVRALKATITRNQGDAALKRLALEGAKRLTKALDAYGILLGEGGKYLEGKCETPPSFKHIFKGTNSALLPSALAVWGRKTEEQKKAVLTDMMVQEFWAAFFREAQGTHYLIKITRPHNIRRGGAGSRKMVGGQVWPKILHRLKAYKKGLYGYNKQKRKGGPDHPGGFRIKVWEAWGAHSNIESKMCSLRRRGHGAGLNAADDGSIQKLRERLIGCLGMGNHVHRFRGKLKCHLGCSKKGGESWWSGKGICLRKTGQGELRSKGKTPLIRVIRGFPSPRRLWREARRIPGMKADVYDWEHSSLRFGRIPAIMCNCCFRTTRMGDISGRIGELISDAANKGQPAGMIRREAIQWCLGNLTHDDAALQDRLKSQLVIRQEMRTVRFDARHMVQGVKLRELIPLGQRRSNCRCWKEDVQECGLLEFSANDRPLIAGIHHEAAKTATGRLLGSGVTVQFDGAAEEASMAACLGLLLKLHKIMAAMWGYGVRRRATFGKHRMVHQKMMIIESNGETLDDFKVANLVMLTWKPFLLKVCGLPENLLPDRVFLTVPSEQSGSYFAACTEAGYFKEGDAIRNIYMGPEDFPKRSLPESAFKAAADEKFIKSLRDNVEGAEEVLEITRGQMAQNKKALKRMKAFQECFKGVSLCLGGGFIPGAFGRSRGWVHRRPGSRGTREGKGKWGPLAKQWYAPEGVACLRVCGKHRVSGAEAKGNWIETNNSRKRVEQGGTQAKESCRVRWEGVRLQRGDAPYICCNNTECIPVFKNMKGYGQPRYEGMQVYVLLDRLVVLVGQQYTGYAPEYCGSTEMRPVIISNSLILNVLSRRDLKEYSGRQGSGFRLVEDNGWVTLSGGKGTDNEAQGAGNGQGRGRVKDSGLQGVRGRQARHIRYGGKEYSGSHILDYKCFVRTCVAERMALFNLHLFGGINSEWDRLYGADGGMLQRLEESRLAEFLDAFEPGNMEALNGMASELMKPKALESLEGTKMLKMEKVPDVSFPNLGFRFIWEAGSVRKMRDFKVGLKVHIRDKVGEKKAIVVKIEDSPVNGDRMCEIFFSLPNTPEECVVVGRARQAVMQSSRIGGAPKGTYHFVRVFSKLCTELPGVYISVTCSKIKDTRAFQELMLRSFPEIAGGQIQEWRMGTKKVWTIEQNGEAGYQEKRAFFTKICMALAIKLAGTGTVALDRRAPDTQWVTFEDAGPSQYLPCQLCHGHDGHYALQRLEKQKGEVETILLCPHKGSCPDCGMVQSAFLYGGHLQECSGRKPECGDCEQKGLPAEHRPMDPTACRSYREHAQKEYLEERSKQASVNKAFEMLMARAIASKGKDFAPYLEARRKASESKAALNGFYQLHEELGDFADQMRTLAPGTVQLVHTRANSKEHPSGQGGLTKESRRNKIRKDMGGGSTK